MHGQRGDDEGASGLFGNMAGAADFSRSVLLLGQPIEGVAGWSYTIALCDRGFVNCRSAHRLASGCCLPAH